MKEKVTRFGGGKGGRERERGEEVKGEEKLENVDVEGMRNGKMWV
jgi:hypothetical protein